MLHSMEFVFFSLDLSEISSFLLSKKPTEQNKQSKAYVLTEWNDFELDWK